MRVYQYPACSTCRKALKWLDEHGIPYEPAHIVDAPPTFDELTEAIQRSSLPLRRFFNTSGQSYREGGFSERLKTMSDREAIEALANDGKLIKRPLILNTGSGKVLVGFKEDEWKAALV